MKKPILIALIPFLLSTSTLANAENNNKLEFDGMDSSIKPGDDFFNHMNKNWMDNAVIADDQVGVGSYRFLNIPQKKLLRDILEEVSVGTHEKGSDAQLVGDFYNSEYS